MGYDHWKTTEPDPGRGEPGPDERPSGWGCCHICFRDCDDQDYDAMTRTTTCQACWLAKRQVAELVERLDPEMREAMTLKGML